MYSMKDLLTLTQYQAYCKVKQVINKFPKDSIRFKDGKRFKRVDRIWKI